VVRCPERLLRKDCFETTLSKQSFETTAAVIVILAVVAETLAPEDAAGVAAFLAVFLRV